MQKAKAGFFYKLQKNIIFKWINSIGDSERDLLAAKAAGIKSRYLITKDSNLPEKNLVSSYHKSVLECVNDIKKESKLF